MQIVKVNSLGIVAGRENKHNKAFKRDSQRLAVLVQSSA